MSAAAPMGFLHLIPLLVFALLIAGCQMHKPPLQGDERYPAEWPRIANLGAECKKLDGLYANQGVVVAPTGDQRSILLTSILPSSLDLGYTAATEVVVLKVHTDKMGRNNTDSIATLEFGIKDEPDSVNRREGGFCIKQAFLYSPRRWDGGVPYLWFGGGQMNVWLTNAEDGSLIAKIWNSSSGLAFVIPYHVERYVWARFDRAEQ